MQLIETVLANIDFAAKVVMANKSLRNELKHDRNVNLDVSNSKDLYADEIRLLPSKLPRANKESERDQELQKKVWEYDSQKCRSNNEALFQRTLMMAMINRSRFFLGYG
jgi:hypothetical protein